MKVAGKAKQIDRMQNTDCREGSNLFHVIDIGCIFNQIEEKNLLSSQELNGIVLNAMRQLRKKWIRHKNLVLAT